MSDLVQRSICSTVENRTGVATEPNEKTTLLPISVILFGSCGLIDWIRLHCIALEGIHRERNVEFAIF